MVNIYLPNRLSPSEEEHHLLQELQPPLDQLYYPNNPMSMLLEYPQFRL